MALLTAKKVINWFRYGSETKPKDLLSNDLIRPEVGPNDENASRVPTSRQDYMDELGKYAHASQFEIVDAFLDKNSSGNYKNNFATGSYDKFEIGEKVVGLGASGRVNDIGLTLEQKNIYDESLGNKADADHGYRTLIWNTTQFKLSDDVRFKVDGSGNRWVENLKITTRNDSDNFDMESSSTLNNIFNDLFLDSVIDPSEINIGRTVIFDFEGEGYKNYGAKYDHNSYLADKANASKIYNPLGTTVFNNVTDLLDDLKSPYEQDGYKIEYGSLEADKIEINKNVTDLQKVAVISGAGNDTITGEFNDNLIYSGAGNDIVMTGIGDDRIIGGAGNDTIDGGLGNDYINGGLGNDLAIGGKGYDIFEVSGLRGAFDIKLDGNHVLLINKITGEMDQLHGIETLRFS